MLLRAEIIHQKANELVRACGTRDTLRIAREIGIYVRFVDGLENLLGMYTYSVLSFTGSSFLFYRWIHIG